MTFKPRQSEFTPEFWAANQPDIARNADFLVANSNDMKWSDARAGASKAEVICQRAQKCEGDQTYDSNMQGNFLAGLGKGIIITKVLEVMSRFKVPHGFISSKFEYSCCLKS